MVSTADRSSKEKLFYYGSGFAWSRFIFRRSNPDPADPEMRPYQQIILAEFLQFIFRWPKNNYNFVTDDL